MGELKGKRTKVNRISTGEIVSDGIVALIIKRIVAMSAESTWDFSKLPPEIAASIRTGLIEPQQRAVAKGTGSPISLALMLLQCGEIAAAKQVLESIVNAVDLELIEELYKFINITGP